MTIKGRRCTAASMPLLPYTKKKYSGIYQMATEKRRAAGLHAQILQWELQAAQEVNGERPRFCRAQCVRFDARIPCHNCESRGPKCRNRCYSRTLAQALDEIENLRLQVRALVQLQQQQQVNTSATTPGSFVTAEKDQHTLLTTAASVARCAPGHKKTPWAGRLRPGLSLTADVVLQPLVGLLLPREHQRVPR